MKNKLQDLNNHLFAQLERFSDEALNPDQLANEINRGKAISGVAQQIIATGHLALEAQERLSENQISHLPELLGLGNGEK
ncbi:MAG: hypothetical protein Q7U98_17115 [Methylicorpusculum sp.]|uniref:hypothetical protein n=1 Tax=Methylicorpusculum sp. TaxID=2713644 RepID=UPI00271BAB57|nr:hypothetical protein [Methylicorpusculum sp.]MDO8940877.1 hypothetical protein [Methylicorpusculum sp.]